MKSRNPFKWALVLLIVWAASAEAMTTVNVKTGSYVIPAGASRENLLIRVQDPKGSVVLNEGSVLKNSQVKCDVLGRTAPAIVVTGNHARLESVQVMGGCDSDGLVAADVTGLRFWQGKIETPRGRGILLAHVTDAELFGVWVANARGDGIVLQGSTGVQLVATLVYVSPGRRGVVLDADSHANQVVRSRARYNGGTMQADASDNLFYHSVCSTRIGAVGCLADGGPQGPLNWGEPAAFTPRWRTACTAASFQGSACDDLTPQEALAASAPGNRVVVDTNKSTGWGNVAIGTEDILLLGNELTMKGNYGYVDYLESLTVTASGVHVQNFDVRGAITAQPDTALVAVE